MAPKRRLSMAAGDGMAARPEKRPQADGGIPDEPAEPPSPGRRLLRQTVLVVLFLIRAKLESMDSRICALTQKVDNITSTSRNGHNHKRNMQETNQEQNSAEAGGLATNEAKGKRMRIRLRFLNGMKSLIYHEDEIRSDRDSAIRIGIFDGNNIIKSGQLSSLKIEILALNGDFPYDASDIWTSEEFSEHIVSGRDGKRNVLVVNEKSYPPKLYDRVHRLEEIANGGKYYDRLRQENIVTVQDFLKALNKDPDNLARILQIKKEYLAWKKMVKHAQGCCLEGNHKLKSYRSTEANVVLFFDCVDRLVGAKFGDHYIASDMFDSDQQDSVDKLKRHAYAQLDGLIDDHVMKDKCPVPINTDADAGPSYKSCIGAGLVVQEQLPSASLNGWCQGLLGQPYYSVATSEVLCFENQNDGAPRLLDPGYTINSGSHVLCAPGVAQGSVQSQVEAHLANSGADPTMPPMKRGHQQGAGGGEGGADGRSGGPPVLKKRCRSFDLEIRGCRHLQELVTTCVQAVQVRLETAVESAVARITEDVTKAITSFLSHAPRTHVDQNRPPRYRLTFMNGLDSEVFTKKDIFGTNGELIKICVSVNDRQGVEETELHRRILSAKIKIVVLDGDFNKHNQECWTSEEFKNYIVLPRDNIGSVLTGVSELSLKNGEAFLCGVALNDNSKFVRCGKFRLGVMIDDNLGERVLEGITEPFIVKDRRGEGSKKHDIPLLHDDVWRMKKIARGGVFHKALKSHDINYVQDFLRLYYKDEQALRKVR
ncbi:hypothetical protein PR202_ga12206 [Eleusine coracana subsp. coracana]|uniref:Calmodulin-binding protein n=1 Tax=Eleusine coracana subsp. coracana TaxID=191504 RepID=A0AAV5CB80_ELECO|nr:hypothetical protein PR202_ga12206 [Eleusine coracana subsp. coracana]